MRLAYFPKGNHQCNLAPIGLYVAGCTQPASVHIWNIGDVAVLQPTTLIHWSSDVYVKECVGHPIRDSAPSNTQSMRTRTWPADARPCISQHFCAENIDILHGVKDRDKSKVSIKYPSGFSIVADVG